MNICSIIAMTGLFFVKNAVKYFYAYLKSVKVKKVAVIGAKTAQYCQDLNIHVDFLPQDFSQEGFLAEFQNKDQKYYFHQVSTHGLN